MDRELFVCVQGGWQTPPPALQLGLSLAQALAWETSLLGLSDNQARRDDLKRRLEAVRHSSGPAAARSSVQVAEGSPIRAIASCVGDSTGLVIVGPLGRSPWLRRVWGPIAGELLRELRSSLVFVPGEAPPAIRHILLAIGALTYSSVAVQWGSLMAQTLNARLTLLHVVQPNSHAPSVMQSPTNLADFLVSDTILAQNYRKALDQLQELGVEVAPRIRVGHPLKEILSETGSATYDLLILGSHYSASNFAHLIGGISPSALRASAIPILVTRKH